MAPVAPWEVDDDKVNLLTQQLKQTQAECSSLRERINRSHEEAQQVRQARENAEAQARLEEDRARELEAKAAKAIEVTRLLRRGVLNTALKLFPRTSNARGMSPVAYKTYSTTTKRKLRRPLSPRVMLNSVGGSRVRDSPMTSLLTRDLCRVQRFGLQSSSSHAEGASRA